MKKEKKLVESYRISAIFRYVVRNLDDEFYNSMLHNKRLQVLLSVQCAQFRAACEDKLD